VPEEKTQSARTDRLGPFGPFNLERRIAVGGTGEVFLARPRQGEKPARELVIKRLSRLRGKANDFDLLSREAELHRAVRHPNVVSVYGAGMVGDEPYLAMEYVPGVDLHRLLSLAASENKTLPIEVAIHVVRSIAAALHAVHHARDSAGDALNITHGDVSPSNIYLSLKGEVKLGDFGIAQARLGADTQRGSRSGEMLRGKVGYFAPERLKGEPVDQRADLFALGVVLGEMLIGDKMFSGSGRTASLLANREANIEPLRRAAGQLPEPLYRVCRRALETDPEVRYPSAMAFVEDLGSPSDERAARAQLAEWVAWARDGNVLVRQFERRLRHSSGLSRASGEHVPEQPEKAAGLSAVRRGSLVTHEQLSLSALIELAATGHLKLDDEVALAGEAFRRVDAIAELARYLMPSTANTTAQLFEPGVPDYTAALRDTPMLDVLARMRNRRETGALFVARTNVHGNEERKDLYFERGRLIHLAAADREDLLGQYLLRHKLITRAELDVALGQLKSYDGRLSEALIGLGVTDRNGLQRSLRNFARDRVAALCSWREGHVQLYRGAKPGAVDAPLDLDLTVPMMTAAMHAGRVPAGDLAERIAPGRRHEDTHLPEERGSAPSSLLELVEIVAAGAVGGAAAIGELIERGKARQRVVGEREARASLTVALALEWIRLQ
jgi:eukaryotic-like serine/threonine-protein kinase